MRLDPAQLVTDDQDEKQQDRKANAKSEGIHGAVALAFVFHHKEKTGKQAADDEKKGHRNQEFHGIGFLE